LEGRVWAFDIPAIDSPAIKSMRILVIFIRINS
jgi:hypothetical protein